MVGKNNWEVQLKRGANKVKRYTIKRTSVGVVSAVVAAGLIFGQETSVQADEITAGESQTTEVSSEAPVVTEDSAEEEVSTELVSEESVIVEESANSEDSWEVSAVEESVEVTETTTDVAQEASAKTVNEQEEAIAAETSIESYKVVTEDQEEVVSEAVMAESETTPVEGEAVQEESESVNAQAQMTTFAATATNIVEADTEFPELISISTNKDVYQAGEDIIVTAIVKENDELSGISVSFGRIGEVKTGSSSLFGDAYSEWSGLTRQSDGTYKAEMVIETDEKMPNNTYQLSSVSMYDAAENRVGLNSYNDTTGLFDLSLDIINEDADTEFPELISISTDKEVYQAGEDITVTAIVKENDELSGISVSFGRIGEVKTGSSSLFGDAYSEWSGLTRQSDGTYKAEMVIETDEKMPNNAYQLSSVSMYDAAGNRVGLNSYNDTTGLFDLSLDIINEDADTEFPELISISTDKEVYQAGEDITVTAIVKENDELSGISVSFGRIGEVKTGSSSLFGDAYSEWSGLTRQSDGTYKAEMVIETDEKMPNNAYQLSSVSMYDAAGNRVGLNSYNDTTGLFDLIVSINVANIPYETIRELNIDLTPNSEDVLVQAGVNGSADATTGELINAPVSEIIHYAPVEIPFETVEVESDDLYFGESALTPGQVGLLDPETNEVILEPVNEIIEIGSKLAPEEIAFETEKILDIHLAPGSSDQLVQEGQVGLRDSETGEVISNPIKRIYSYAPTIVDYEIIRMFNPNQEPDSIDIVAKHGEIGLMDPETNEVVIKPIAEVISFAPVTMAYDVEYQIDDSLEPNSGDTVELQPGSEGLQNPDTGEVLVAPVNQIIGQAPTEYIDDTTVQNIITIVDQVTNQEIASTTFLGNEYSVRLNYFINQLNSQSDLELEVVDEKTTSDVLRSSTVNGFTVSSRTIKKNIYVVNNNNTDTTIEKPFLPEGVIYNNQDYVRAYRKVTIQDNGGRELYRVNYVAYESTDETIRNAMSNINSSDYYYDSVDVSEGFTSIVGSTGSYRGPLKEITILVNRIEEPETPVEPEVPEVEEPETPVEPEVPEVEEPETPVEPEVPEVEEPETPVEPELPDVEEPETPVEPEVPEVEEPEMPAEPELPEVEEPATPAEPELPAVEEPETPVVENPETVVESEVPTNDVKAPVATSEDGVVVAEPITTPAQTVATEGAKAESEVVLAETVLSAEVKAEETSTTVDDQVATLPAAGAQTMSALATGLGVITTALGGILVRKKK